MKLQLLFFLVMTIFLASACGTDEAQKQEEEKSHEHTTADSDTDKPAKKPLSPRTTAMGNIGDMHIHIDYSAPSVRARTIWGGLVAYDQVWSTGAHKATSISFDKAVKIDGVSIPVGTYGFFTIPGKEKWTLILNQNHEQHLADDYDPALDLVRVLVEPEVLPETVETLSYIVLPKDDTSGHIAVAWDQLRVRFLVEVEPE